MGGCASCLLRALRTRPAGGGKERPPDSEPGPLDEALGHSFRYVRADPLAPPAAATAETAFKSISGASVPANSTSPSIYDASAADARLQAAGFRSSASFNASPFHLSTGCECPASGPIDRGFSPSGPILRRSLSGPIDAVPFSGPLVKKKSPSVSRRLWLPSLFRRSLSQKNRQPWVVPIRSFTPGRCDPRGAPPPAATAGRNVQWAHGKAGEDRVHVVVSEEHRWLFVGIYDGFNGPEAPEFLVGNLYRSVFDELRGLFWEEVEAKAKETREVTECGPGRRTKAGPVADHELVLRALSRALEVTELAYLETTDRALDSNPELAMMGSCLLVVLMRDDDVYVMNVGDSRAIVAQYRPRKTAEKRNEATANEQPRVVGGNEMDVGTHTPGQEETELVALQLSTDHNTSIKEEVLRIKKEHPDDSHCIVNDRVKGRLKVTRAFGAGYLKQPKWNEGLVEMFRNEFIGNAPYITCMPSLCHHKLGSNDQFVVLSSDGLYQYLSNEEAVLHVENFMERFPDGDPAQSLIEELLFRAAKKAGMDFYELLDIPQGDRRKYHDDVTVMVISLEGRIWKSTGNYV